ncbi:hypothetical protein [Rhizorhapis sp. SPR117]|uniref:hypothetical protein n=1 Tax=Rhizorhapis sp. SPR117 TaxID=2912611 RepID=UPI001F31EB64|nr:hypothetical protein [Rhizorhapis sp. SPR117]
MTSKILGEYSNAIRNFELSLRSAQIAAGELRTKASALGVEVFTAEDNDRIAGIYAASTLNLSDRYGDVVAAVKARKLT